MRRNLTPLVWRHLLASFPPPSAHNTAVLISFADQLRYKQGAIRAMHPHEQQRAMHSDMPYVPNPQLLSLSMPAPQPPRASSYAVPAATTDGIRNGGGGGSRGELGGMVAGDMGCAHLGSSSRFQKVCPYCNFLPGTNSSRLVLVQHSSSRCSYQKQHNREAGPALPAPVDGLLGHASRRRIVVFTFRWSATGHTTTICTRRPPFLRLERQCSFTYDTLPHPSFGRVEL